MAVFRYIFFDDFGGPTVGAGCRGTRGAGGFDSRLDQFEKRTVLNFDYSLTVIAFMSLIKFNYVVLVVIALGFRISVCGLIV